MFDAVGSFINLVVDLFALFVKGVWMLIKWIRCRMSTSTAENVGTADVSRSGVECKPDLNRVGRPPNRIRCAILQKGEGSQPASPKR
jgi:hypothetical protein